MPSNIEVFIRKMPKAELHVHIEGTLEPNLMLKLARRNNISVKYKSEKSLRQAYNFSDLQEFLDVYYEGSKVLVKEEDFYELTLSYFKKAKEQNVVHAEIFFDPQTHLKRGVEFKTIINGISRATVIARKKLKISSRVIMCFLRDLSEKDAFKTLELALQYKKWIYAIGLDSAEIGNSPVKFKKVFRKAAKYGLCATAHAGEEGPAQYIWDALKELKVLRIDHGNRCVDDEKLIRELARRQIPLTLCPLSNLKLKVVKKIESHPIRAMMANGLLVTINSDDPAYFGGYVNENYLLIQKTFNLTKEELITLSKNSFLASFLSEKEKLARIKKLNQYAATF